MNILINGKKYPVEVKLTQKAKSRGMMGRKHLEGGMLFIFNNPKEQYFWMKNCLVPLDIVFLDNGKITDIHHSCKPCESNDCPTYVGYGNMVLEFLGGFCEKNNLTEDDLIEFVQ
jgi:uncharacterized protein